MSPRRDRGPRGVSVVPSAEGQRAAYDVGSEVEAQRAVEQSNRQADTLLGRLRRKRHRHEWDYGGRGISGWGIAECRTCGKTDLY